MIRINKQLANLRKTISLAQSNNLVYQKPYFNWAIISQRYFSQLSPQSLNRQAKKFYQPLMHKNYLQSLQKIQEASEVNQIIQISITQEASQFKKIVRKRKTARQKILESKFFQQWIICFAISIFLVFGGHMYFPQSFLSTNIFVLTSYDITRNAERQVLSGKHGTPIIPKKTI